MLVLLIIIVVLSFGYLNGSMINFKKKIISFLETSTDDAIKELEAKRSDITKQYESNTFSLNNNIVAGVPYAGFVNMA